MKVRGERRLKGRKIAVEDVDSAWIHCTQILLALQNVQGSTTLGACFGEHQRTTRKIKCRELIAACQLCS